MAAQYVTVSATYVNDRTLDVAVYDNATCEQDALELATLLVASRNVVRATLTIVTSDGTYFDTIGSI